MLQYQLKMEDAPVLHLLDSIITRGLEENASDIHLEPGERYCRIRYRVDGVLQQEQRNIPEERHGALASCLKLMAGMDIAEKRVPQDGRAQITWKDKRVDLRISSLPTIMGESVVVRILDSQTGRLSLDEMGFTKEALLRYRTMFQAPYGLILLTGPTGSGKTTTLYATLQELNRPERNIVTVEDPVEYRMEGINQVAVNLKAGMTFAGGLRSILRQDPNVIMIGEIRDRETAAISIQAALTGHLVFSTLHTNTAAGAITRLADMGTEPFLIASALRGIVAQRLVRKLCPACRKKCMSTLSSLERKRPDSGITDDFPDRDKCFENGTADGLYGMTEPGEIQLYEANGCEQCHQSGYHGRVAIHEVLPISPALKYKISCRVSEQEIWETARAEFPDLVSLEESGLRKVHDGITSRQELFRVLGV